MYFYLTVYEIYSCGLLRKPDCDIRIQLPQVSKEHCRIDLNENKEVTLCAGPFAHVFLALNRYLWENECVTFIPQCNDHNIV